MPRAQKATGKTRHDPLHVQLGEDEVYAKYGKVSHPGKRRKSHAKDEEEEESGEVCIYSDRIVLHITDPAYR